MKSKVFNMSLPVELVELIDRQAKLGYSSRSEFIKNTIVARFKADNIVYRTEEQDAFDEAAWRRRKLSRALEKRDLRSFTEDVY